MKQATFIRRLKKPVNIYQPICPKCESKWVMYVKKGNSYWCRRCGAEWEKCIEK